MRMHRLNSVGMMEEAVQQSPKLCLHEVLNLINRLNRLQTGLVHVNGALG